jgi:hypothetical protein
MKTLIIGFLNILIAGSVFGQNNYILAGEKHGSDIFYTDIIPDIVIENHHNNYQTFLLDIDNDNIDDLQFIIAGAQSPGGIYEKDYRVTTIGSTRINVTASHSTWADIRNYDDVIGENLIWSGGTKILWFYSYCPGSNPSGAGLWENAINKYLGIKKTIDGNPRYIWLLMSVQPSKITFSEYAFKDIIVGIDETEASDFEIYPTLTSDKVFISYDKVLGEKVKLSVFYQNGQLFHDYTLITPFSTNISLENCPTGIYIIAIYGNGFNIKKKVVKI